jgi:hypothetical protein
MLYCWLQAAAHFFFSKKDEQKIVWKVESTPPIFYDAIEVYPRYILSDSSGNFMLLQAEMDKKKQAAKEEMSKYDIDLGSLSPGEIKNAHRLYTLPYKVESVFNVMTGNHVTDKVSGWWQRPQGHKLRVLFPP